MIFGTRGLYRSDTLREILNEIIKYDIRILDKNQDGRIEKFLIQEHTLRHSSKDGNKSELRAGFKAEKEINEK